MPSYDVKLLTKERSFARKVKVVRVRGKGGFVQAQPGDQIVWSRLNGNDPYEYSVRFYGVDDEDQRNELWPFSSPLDPVTPSLRFLKVAGSPVTTTLGSVATYKYAVDANNNRVEPLDPMIIVRDSQLAKFSRTALATAAIGAAVGVAVGVAIGAMATALVLRRC